MSEEAHEHVGAEEHSYAAPGLKDEVEILVDRWGVPHAYASSVDDAFFAQGWNAARDRLWQIDLWRRRGLLSEAFGPAFVERRTGPRGSSCIVGRCAASGSPTARIPSGSPPPSSPGPG